MRSSMVLTLTGVPASLNDIEPVEIEFFACASRLGLRPSQPTDAFAAAWPNPISGCDLRALGLPESLSGRASVTTQPSSGAWQPAQAVLPDAEMRVSKNSSRPRLTSALFPTVVGGGRR